MAVGDGGFSTQMGGFNKNEVNEYISNLRKKMNELEAEMKDNDSKVKAAVKTADEAESKIQKLEQEKNEKISELELQIKTERKNAENLLDKIDDLKRKVKNKGSGAAEASSEEALKQAAEVIEKANITAKKTVDEANKTAKKTVEEANKTAREVVEKAKQTAKEIVENAQSTSAAGGGSSVNLDGIMSELRGFFDKMSNEYKAIISKVEELSTQSGAEPKAVEIPDFSGFEAPAAAAPAEAVAVTAEAPEAEAPEFSEPEKTEDISFENLEEISSDDTETNNFEEDMMGAFGNIDDVVAEVKENDTSHHSKAAFDMDFDKDLIAQTVPSSSLNANEIDEDLLAAVRREEEKFAVQPTDGREDFDMNSMSMDDDNAADDGAEAMRRMLAEAEAAFGGGSSLEYDVDNQQEDEPAPAAASANPWEDLQKQLEAMEQSGNFGGNEPESSAVEEPAEQPSAVEDPQVPTTDDSSIWDFSSDSSSSSDDDDMSTDLFANF